MGAVTGLLLSLPLVLTVAWYGWSAFAQVDRYKRGTEDVAPWTMELFQIALHDELLRDFRRMSQSERPANSTLSTFALSLNRDNLDALNGQLYGAKRSYVNGYVQKDGVIHEVQARYRGSKPWHWIGNQKSTKLRLDRGDLLDGTRIFNLLNDPTPFGMEAQIIFEIARQLGLITPDYSMVRVRLNNSDMGVYHYAVQPVEGVLRRGRRMPGALYSGDTDSVDVARGVGSLFFGRHGWQQVTERMAGAPNEFEPLDRLLEAVQHASHGEFATFAEHHMDLDRYAAFDALDVVFGGNEHDYFSNHKVYFDPYRGRFEPVVWGFRSFRHEPTFNLVDNPLLVRLKMTPGYTVLRNRAVFDLLTGKASVPQVRMLADGLFEEVAPDLNTDPYWDSYKLLPRVTRFHRFMTRPMSTEKWLLAAQAQMHQYGRRARYLMDQLDHSNVQATAYAVSPTLTRVDLVVNGHGAEKLREVTVSGACGGGFEWRADLNRNGRVDSADSLLLSGQIGVNGAVGAYNCLLPGVRLSARPDPLPKRGVVQVEPTPQTYTYLLSAACPLDEIALVLTNPVSGRSSRLTPIKKTDAPVPRQVLPGIDSIPSLAVGERAPHPWDFPVNPAPEILQLGPALVEVDETRIFPPHQQVVIAAGTHIKLGAGVSLIFQGRVTARGTTGQPIVISAADEAHPFGGIAIQGAQAAGSVFKHVHVSGGTQIGHVGVDFPSLFSVYDTRDILLECVRFVNSVEAEDVFHATYVQALRLHEVIVTGAPVDGIDLEFSDGELRGVRVEGAGDDCLDLMGVNIQVSDSILQGCANNAISAGEESQLNAHGLFISDSETGLMAKNDSHARITRSLIFRTGTALKTKRRDIHYAGASSIGASDLFVAECDKTLEAAPDTRIEAGSVHQALPAPGALDHLAQHVLGLAEWSGFESYVAGLAERQKL
jgi:hypothetical protein